MCRLLYLLLSMLCRQETLSGDDIDPGSVYECVYLAEEERLIVFHLTVITLLIAIIQIELNQSCKHNYSLVFTQFNIHLI